MPLREHVEVSAEEPLPTPAPPDLAARRCGDPQRLHHNDGGCLDLMVLGDRRADGGNELADVDITDPVAVDFLYDDELFGGTRSRRDRERRPATA